VRRVAKVFPGSVTDSPGITEYLDAPRRTWITDMSRVFEFCDLFGFGGPP